MFLIAAGATLRLREENGVTNHVAKELAVALGACLLAMALSGPTLAASPHQGSVGSSGAAVVTGSLPGQVLWGYYLTTQSGELCPPGANTTGDILCNTEGAGDNIIRLVNPNGAANANLAGAKAETVCAMVYVFDDDQEMGECCGCPVTSAQLATFSVEKNLTSNWALRGGESAAHGSGAIAIVAAVPNAASTCTGQSGTCHGGCDSTNVPGYSVTNASNLLGSLTHNQAVAPHSLGISEIGFFDDGGGDPTNLIYLQEQCGALVGNSSGGGICNCPTEG